MSFARTVNIRRQGLTILTTEACNFACRYCHQPHDHVHMSPEVSQSIIRFIERKAPNLDTLDISWFGGEPLVNIRELFRLSEEFCRICQMNNVKLHGFMSTNGYLLTDELLKRLVRLGITRYQITFDGPEEVHDLYRLSGSGGPTFSRIWKNITSFRELEEDFEILIRVHVTPQTIIDVASFLGELEKHFSFDDRFKITLANVSHWGGPNDHTIPVFDDPDQALKPLHSLIAPSNACSGDNVYCNAADPTHMVIRPGGMIVKCAHSLELEENRIGFLSPDGRFIYEPGKIDFWIRGIESFDQEALRCPRNGIEDPSSSKMPLVQINLPSSSKLQSVPIH